MIPRIRAIAIDDNLEHLGHIKEAAESAAIGCLPIHYPGQATAENFTSLNLPEARIRIVISDLHLNAGTETAGPQQVFGTIAGLLHQLKLSDWTPYVLVLWTQHGDQLDGLRVYLEERLPPENLPSLVVALDKGKYGIGDPEDEGKDIDRDSLWNDLRSEIQKSKGVNLLLQWESEVLHSADGVARSLLKLARRNRETGAIERKICIDDGVDRVISLVARTATSYSFAKENPRSAANEGLIPLLADEIQHMSLEGDAQERWKAGLSERVTKILPATTSEVSFFNDAFLISREGAMTGTLRGAVVDGWHSDEEFFELFGRQKTDLRDVFGLENVPANPLTIKYIQIEGQCDSAQQKKGVVPFVLACEVLGDTALKKANAGKDSRPSSVEDSPIYRHDDGSEWKLILNLRYFFTISRESAKSKPANFRIRESLIAKWAFSWANHTIRPGIVEFRNS